VKTIEHIRDFLDAFITWVSDQPDVQGVALVGSYARGAARDESDIDLVILTDQPPKYFENILWIERFGLVEKRQTEDYGKLTSLRVWYQDGIEVEYGITIKDAPNGLRYRRLRRKRAGNRKLLKLGKRAESQPSGWLRSSVRCWGPRFVGWQFTHEGP
jgi:predicted nucleotidyltransferase